MTVEQLRGEAQTVIARVAHLVIQGLRDVEIFTDN